MNDDDDDDERVYQLERKVEELSEKIDNIGNENMINHSLSKESNELITSIENDIKKTRKENGKRFCIKNIKIFGKAIQGILPYLVATIIPFVGQILVTDDIPLYPQKEFKFAHYEETIDRTGLISSDTFYNNDKSISIDTAYLYSKWEQKSDGKWYRSIKKYDLLSSKSVEEYIEIANNFDKYNYGTVDEFKYEVRKDAPSEEENVAYIKFIHRSNNREDVMLLPQDLFPNVAYSSIFIVLAGVLNGLVYIYRDVSKYDFSGYRMKIKNEYPQIDIDRIIKLFEEEKIRYERIIHPEVVIEDPVTNEKVYMK